MRWMGLCVGAMMTLSMAACCGGGSVDTSSLFDFEDGQEITCIDSPILLGTQERGSFTVTCPADCSWGSVWGTDTYTADSSICVAAIHAGVLDKSGGKVKVATQAGLQEHKGSERNGVTSSDWGSYDRSYTVAKP